MEHEKEYIDYLIKNKDIENVDHLLENYLNDTFSLNDIDIEIMNKQIDILSYKNFTKSKKIDNLFK